MRHLADPRSGSYRYVVKSSGRRLTNYLRIGCLLLILISILCSMSLGILYVSTGIPLIMAGKPENLPDAAFMAIDYLKELARPLPNDVILTKKIINFANAKGLTTTFGRHYQVQACIAAAERFGIKREHLCALMELEGGWPSQIESNSFVIASSRALLLLELGYDNHDRKIEKGYLNANGKLCKSLEDCEEPVTYSCTNATCEALLDYFANSMDTLEMFETVSNEWSIANTATLTEPSSKWEWLRFPELTYRFWTLLNLGYGVVYEVDGVKIIVINPGTPPPNHLPEMPDGMIVSPVEGGYISGHRFGASNTGEPFPRHTGLDLAGGDSWVRAAHNGTVTYAAYLDPHTSLAAQIWSSGNQVVIKSEFPDGTPFCTGYGHGANLNVRVGQKVNAGDVVFKMGDTGYSEGIHLHWNIIVGGSGPTCSGGYFIDPEPFLK